MVSGIPRLLEDVILENLKSGLVLGLFGARRTGKTFLMERIRNRLKDNQALMVQGDNLDVAEILSSQRLSMLQQFTTGYTYLFIDEAQKIPNIGNSLKLIVDTMPDLKIFVTGSSAFDLKNKVGEPLTGRNKYFYLYPIAQKELGEDFLQSKQNLESRIIYGSYPQVITAENDNQRKDILESIKNGVLLKDLLELDNIKDSIFIMNLLRLIAFQIGNDVSQSELANTLGVSKNTVARYLELLEKCYIIFSLQSLSRNLRKEISKSRRYFFWDNGIRNVIISNFNRLALRDDIGRLWENYCISERMKKNHYLNERPNYYFWRTYDQAEIDLIEEADGKLNAFEFKWKEKKTKPPRAFINSYVETEFTLIHNNNYLDFIT
jgi:predicted AAA+ superfamily ATPase